MSDTPTPTPMPEGVIQVPFRTKPSPGDVEAAKQSSILPVKADGTPEKRIQFKRFENGMVFGFSANPRKPGTYIIHDATGTPYAIALHPSVADLICQAVTGLFLAREQKAKEQSEAVDALTEATATDEVPAPPAPAPETPVQ